LTLTFPEAAKEPKGKAKKAIAKTVRTKRPATFIPTDVLTLSGERLLIIIVSFSLTHSSLQKYRPTIVHKPQLYNFIYTTCRKDTQWESSLSRGKKGQIEGKMTQIEKK
jgi:hypothetical protein